MFNKVSFGHSIFGMLALTFLCVLSLASAQTNGWDKLSQDCKEKIFPISSGGGQDEFVSCTVFDEKHQQIIVAGNSTSEDYAPAANDHAFVYAVDLEGNWKWGKFYYNVSFAVSTISGCAMDDNGRLMAMAVGDQKPIVMEIELSDGTVANFISFEKLEGDENRLPQFATAAGVYHDVRDRYDGQSYYYLSFFQDDIYHVLRVRSATKEIVWNYIYEYQLEEDAYKKLFTPGYIHQDPNDRDQLYLLGRFHNRASVIKFGKQSMGIDWKLQIGSSAARQQAERDGTDVDTAVAAAYPSSDMNEILSYVQPDRSDKIYACGYRWTDAATAPGNDAAKKSASMFKMDSEGRVLYLYMFGTRDEEHYDTCRGIDYDAGNREIVLIMEVTSPALRPDYDLYAQYSGSQRDLLILTMKTEGRLLEAYNINMRDASIDLFVGNDAMFANENHYIFGGYSWGYKTVYQNSTYDIASPNYDTYVFKYDPRQREDCLYQAALSSSELRSMTTSTFADYTKAILKLTQSEVVADLEHDRYLFKQVEGEFITYSSQYSGSFDLQDTFKYPKMCATASKNITDGVVYYRGQNELAFSLGAETDVGGIVSRMGAQEEMSWNFYNGTSATGKVGRFDKAEGGGTFYIKADAESAVGKQRTLLRSCAASNLYELYLYIEVKNNNNPDFAEDIDTTFRLTVGKAFEYRLPPVVDKEENDETEVYVKAVPDQPYPNFLFFENSTNTLIFRPEDEWDKGKIFYFQLIVKEKNSDVIFYPYFCKVIMLGQEQDASARYTYQDNEWHMYGHEDRSKKENWVGADSRTGLYFNHSVDTAFVAENFDRMFDLNIRNVSYREKKVPAQLLAYEFTGLNATHMDMTVTFREPYMLGLLVKKSDRLYIKMKRDILDTTGRFDVKKGYDYLNGMFLNQERDDEGKTLMTLHAEKCLKDAGDDGDTGRRLQEKSEQRDPYYNRDRIFGYSRIDLQFDFRNELMAYWRQLAQSTYWYLLGVIVIQFVMLALRQVGFLPLWTLIEYMQLCAFIPLYNFRMIPYLYDAFKPFLVSHLVLTNDALILKEMEDDYFEVTYRYFWLNTAKLGQALAFMVALFALTVVLNIVIGVAYCLTPNKQGRCGQVLGGILSQFKFNVYIRLYMLTYFDLTFFSVMKIVEGNPTENPSELRKVATIVSYIILVLSAVVPFFLMFVVCRRFEVMKIKHAKAAFNTVVLKLDKQSRWRLVVPGYFFFRRYLTACLLSMPQDNTFIFLQYVFILMSSHAYVLFLVAIKPYQSPLLNNYMLANETFYSALIIAIFIFSDATPELGIKIAAGVVLIAAIFLLIFSNFLMILVLMWRGKARLKDEIKQAKLKRAEKELMEEEEEEDRRQRQKREEEEFTRLPEDTTNMSQYDLSAATNTNLTTGADLLKSSKKRKGKKNKNKNNNDEVEELNMGNTEYNTTEMGHTTQGANDTQEPLAAKKKKKKKRDKNKGKQDDLVSMATSGAKGAPLEEEYMADLGGNAGKSTTDGEKGKKTKGSSDEPSGSSSSDKKDGKDKKKKKKSKKVDQEDEKVGDPGAGSGDLL